MRMPTYSANGAEDVLVAELGDRHQVGACEGHRATDSSETVHEHGLVRHARFVDEVDALREVLAQVLLWTVRYLDAEVLQPLRTHRDGHR